MRHTEATGRASTGPLPHGRTTAFHQVLILLAIYLFGGGGDVPLGERVREAVGDEGRREAAGAVADEIQAEMDGRLAGLVELRGAFYTLLRRYDATPAELDAVLGRGVDEAERAQAAVLDARMRLCEVMTASEWEELCEGSSAPAGW